MLFGSAFTPRACYKNLEDTEIFVLSRTRDTYDESCDGCIWATVGQPTLTYCIGHRDVGGRRCVRNGESKRSKCKHFGERGWMRSQGRARRPSWSTGPFMDATCENNQVAESSASRSQSTGIALSSRPRKLLLFWGAAERRSLLFESCLYRGNELTSWGSH